MVKTMLEFLLLWSTIPLANSINLYADCSLEHCIRIGFIYSCVFVLVMAAFGLFNRYLRDNLRAISFRVVLAFIVVFIVMASVFYSWPALSVSRMSFLYALLFSAIALTLTRTSCYFLVKHNKLYRKRIVVYGAGHRASLLTHLRRKADKKHFDCIGFIPLPGEEVKVENDLLLTYPENLLDFVKKNHIEQIVIALDDKRKVLPIRELLDNKVFGTEIIEMATFFERNTGRIKLQSIHPSHLVFSNGFIQTQLNENIKRLIDLVSSLILFAVTWPIMLITAFLIMLESGFKGTVFYKQTRVGQHNNNFEVLKFRSMSMDAEKNGAQWATQRDARVTKVGNFIRKTRIDELPQLFNVIKGEMSFVGPRPERPQFVEELSESIPFYEIRHFVKPGITGWAQICYPYGATEEDSKNKLEFDLYYMKNYSLFLDVMILLHTVQVILWRQGAR